jgi:hypothetical protein
MVESFKWEDFDPGRPGQKANPSPQNNRAKNRLEQWLK